MFRVFIFTAYHQAEGRICVWFFFFASASILSFYFYLFLTYTRGVPNKELGLLRKKGIEISEKKLKPLFAYVGDTSIKVFEDNPELFNYPVSSLCQLLFFLHSNSLPLLAWSAPT
jgi:hypothetical protein